MPKITMEVPEGFEEVAQSMAETLTKLARTAGGFDGGYRHFQFAAQQDDHGR